VEKQIRTPNINIIEGYYMQVTRSLEDVNMLGQSTSNTLTFLSNLDNNALKIAYESLKGWESEWESLADASLIGYEYKYLFGLDDDNLDNKKINPTYIAFKNLANNFDVEADAIEEILDTPTTTNFDKLIKILDKSFYGDYGGVGWMLSQNTVDYPVYYVFQGILFVERSKAGADEKKHFAITRITQMILNEINLIMKEDGNILNTIEDIKGRVSK
jgi:hypothetical protein